MRSATAARRRPIIRLRGEIVNNVPIYDGEAIRAAARNPDRRREMMAEWGWAMLDGPGVIILSGAIEDISAVDAATEVFFALIAEQRRGGKASGDHFAKPGANDRVWNAQEKLA